MYPVKIYTIDGVLVYQVESGGDNTNKSPKGGVIVQSSVAESMEETIEKPITFYGDYSPVISQAGHNKDLYNYYWTSYSRGTDGRYNPNEPQWHNAYLDGYIPLRVKSIYDPCPYLYRIPSNGTYNQFDLNPGWTDFSYLGGASWNMISLGESWLPALGWRNAGSSAFDYTGVLGFYRLSTTGSQTAGYTFTFIADKGIWINRDNQPRSYGISVRCIDFATLLHNHCSVMRQPSTGNRLCACFGRHLKTTLRRGVNKNSKYAIYNYLCEMKKYLSLIKFSHTIFALPFALIGYFIAVKETNFEPILLVQVLACMVLARSSAMAFNRIVDRKFDKQNPRTASREIPSGVVSLRSANLFFVISVVGFVAVTASINALCLVLSPLALLVILGYSYTKRFTALCHLILGLGLAIAPTAAYIAVTGTFAMLPILFSCLVFTWVSGFDIIFALQDVEFDKGAKLHSLPALLGLRNALIVSALLHAVTAFFVILIGIFYLSSVIYIVGAVIFIAMLVYQHAIVRPSDLSRVGIAFGTTNGIASVVFATFTIISLFVK